MTRNYKEITRAEIDQTESIDRINLINSCTGYKSANLIGTRSAAGQDNVAVFSSVVHLGSNPPLLGFVTRPTTVPRHTLENIRETKSYTINHIHQAILFDAHHTSAKYPREISEFDKTSLSAQFRENCHAPFVADCPVQIEMHYLQEIPIEANGTILVIGEIKNLYVQEELLQADGFIDLVKGKVATINGLDAYAVPEENQRFAYQRPKEK